MYATHKALFLYSGAVASHWFWLVEKALIYFSARPVGTHSSTYSTSDAPLFSAIFTAKRTRLQTEEAPMPMNNR